MAREPQTITICDDDGNHHEYLCTPHPAGQGVKLGVQLLQFVGPGIVGILREVLKQVEKERGTDKITINKLIGSEINFGPLADAAGGLLSNLGSAPELVKELLKNTVRDGKLLSNNAEFDIAFQGNYGELIEAVMWAFGVNRFLGFFSRRSMTS